MPVARNNFIALRGDALKQFSPGVKYRGIFLNDEDFFLCPWAAKKFEPETGNIGPKTYARIFGLLLRLRANCLWSAMHPDTAAFNSFPANARLADEYGIVMGASHCEQMLRNNVSEWTEQKFGDYNFVANPDSVLKYDSFDRGEYNDTTGRKDDINASGQIHLLQDFLRQRKTVFIRERIAREIIVARKLRDFFTARRVEMNFPQHIRVIDECERNISIRSFGGEGAEARH